MFMVTVSLWMHVFWIPEGIVAYNWTSVCVHVYAQYVNARAVQVIECYVYVNNVSGGHGITWPCIPLVLSFSLAHAHNQTQSPMKSWESFWGSCLSREGLREKRPRGDGGHWGWGDWIKQRALKMKIMKWIIKRDKYRSCIIQVGFFFHLIYWSWPHNGSEAWWWRYDDLGLFCNPWIY